MIAISNCEYWNGICLNHWKILKFVLSMSPNEKHFISARDIRPMAAAIGFLENLFLIHSWKCTHLVVQTKILKQELKRVLFFHLIFLFCCKNFYFLISVLSKAFSNTFKLRYCTIFWSRPTISAVTKKKKKKLVFVLWTPLPANIYVFQVNNKNTRRKCKICSKSTIKTPVLVFLLLTLNILHFFFYCFYCWLWRSNC